MQWSLGSAVLSFAVCFYFYGDHLPSWLGHPEIKFNRFTLRYKEKVPWKLKKICFSPKVPIQPCRPKSYSAPPGAIWVQFKPKQPDQKSFL